MKKIAICMFGTFVALVLGTGCKERFTNLKRELGAPVDVPLELVFAPVDGAQAGKGTNKSVSVWESSELGAVSGYVSRGPLTRSESRTVEEAQVANMWILQFESKEDNAVLVYSQYVPTYRVGSLIKGIRASGNSRIVVVANAPEGWGKDFTINTNTWQDVRKATHTITGQGDLLKSVNGTQYIPMTGSYTGSIGANMPIMVYVERTVAKLEVNIMSGTDLSSTTFDVQLRNVAAVSSWFVPEAAVEQEWPHGGANLKLIDYPKQNVTGVSTTGFKTLTYWVPVNRRGTIAGAEEFTRATNAPDGATYLELVSPPYTYKVHLGADFLEDYNLEANTAYSYYLTLQTDPEGNDSRVTDSRNNLGRLTQNPGNNILPSNTEVTVKSPNAMAGVTWTASLSNTDGFRLGDITGMGSNRTAKVIASINPTAYARSTTLTATASSGGATESITITQAASFLSYSSPSTVNPVPINAREVFFTITGTDGLVCTVSRQGGDIAFGEPSPNHFVCNGKPITVTVPITGDNSKTARQANYTVSVNMEGGADGGLNISNILVKQLSASSSKNKPVPGKYVEGPGGLLWTTGPLVAKNTSNHECVVGDMQDGGLYFQFGSLIGWAGGSGGTGTGRPNENTQSPACATRVWPLEMGDAGKFLPWQDNNGTGQEFLSNFYFNYSRFPWDQDGVTPGSASSDIGVFGEYVWGEGVPSGNLRGGRYANLGVGDPCTYYLGEHTPGNPWRLPTADEFKKLCNNVGGKNKTWTAVGGKWDDTNKGGWFYNEKLFFAASGYRNTDKGTFLSINKSGIAWSGSTNSPVTSCYLGFLNTFVDPQTFNPRSYGFPVRCVANK